MKEHAMKRLLALALLLVTSLPIFPSAVTYSLSGGYFGDNLVSFSHALWVSYKRNIPLLYRPFKKSDKLELSRSHNPYNPAAVDQFQEVVEFPNKSDVKYDISNLNTDKKILYIIPYFPHCRSDIEWYNFFHYDIDWDDPGFIALLRKEIASIDKRPMLDFPEGRLPVAVHIRTGGDFDHIFQCRKKSNSRSKASDQYHPLKFPPGSFYIEQIKRMSELLDDQPMYVHIFTDNPHPESFIELFKLKVDKPNIEYGYRQPKDHVLDDFLDDFFSLTQFDYLIRGESNFSIIAEQLAQCKICIFPTAHVWEGRTLIINKVETKVR